MNFETLKKHIEGKERLSNLEKGTLTALQDANFLNDYGNLAFLGVRYRNVVLRPASFDRRGAPAPEYLGLLAEVSTFYKAYLYDQKGKYTNLKRDIQEVEQSIEKTKKALDKTKKETLEALNKDHEDLKGQLGTVQNSVTKAQKAIEHIDKTAKLISGASVLAAYAKDFNKGAVKHNRTANRWLRRLKLSIFGLVVLVTFLLFVNIAELPWLRSVFAEDLMRTEYLYIIVLALKAGLVIAYLQIVFFLKRNYYAEKHLEQASIHRRDVLRALHAVYNTLEDKVEKDKVISTGAAIAFSEAESGYITTKEGAGGDDATAAFIARIWK